MTEIVDTLNTVVSDVAALTETVDGLTSTTTSMDTNLTNWWLMYGTVLVFLMQAGFALLEAGSISSKNVKNVLVKNLLDACAGGLVWWAVGYSFAYGDSEKKNEFIGSRNYFMYSLVQSSADGYYAGWMFQWVSNFDLRIKKMEEFDQERCNDDNYFFKTSFP